jgi:hypothetical protein
MRLATFEINGATRIGVVIDGDPGLMVEVSSTNGDRSDLMPIVAGGESMRRWEHEVVCEVDRIGRLSNRVRQRP